METKGIYGFIRHPSYLAIGVLDSVPGLIVGSLTGTLILVVGTIPQTLYRLEQEERELEKSFGHDFKEYQKHSARVIPMVY